MRTKEDIVKGLMFCDKYYKDDTISEELLFEAMDEWGKEISISFEKWRRNKIKEGKTGLVASKPAWLFRRYLQETSSLK